jgi:hypothetical protein
MSNNTPFKLEDLINNIDDTYIPPPLKNEVVPNQMISFIKNNKKDNKMIDFQTPKIDITHAGWPQSNNPLYETPKQRVNAYSIPIKKDGLIYEYFTKLQNKVEENLDELVPEDMKGKIVIQDFIREYENKTKKTIEYSVRARFALKKDDDVETSIWRKEGNTIKEVPIKTVSDLEKEVKYGSTVQYIVRINKFYISTKNEGTKKDPKYKMGITLKIMSVQLFGSSATKSVDYKNNYTFNNDDEVDEVDVENLSVIDTSKLDDVDEVDGEEEDDE